MQFLTEHTITTLRGIAQAPSEYTADEITEAVSALLGAVQGGTPLVVGYDPIAYLTDAVTDAAARSAIEGRLEAPGARGRRPHRQQRQRVGRPLPRSHRRRTRCRGAAVTAVLIVAVGLLVAAQIRTWFWRCRLRRARRTHQQLTGEGTA